MTNRPARLAFLALACLAATVPTGGTPRARGAATVPTWAPPVIVDADEEHSAGEPSLSVAPDGEIYISAPRGLLSGDGDVAWRSDDEGASWTYLGSYDVPFGGGDADVVAGPGGTVYASGLYLACVSVARSADKGATWANVPVTCSDSPVDDRQWNALSPDGAVYTAFGSAVTGTIVVNRSLVSDPGVIPGPNVSVSDMDFQWVGVIALDPTEGLLYVVWNTSGEPNDCDVDDCEAGSGTPDEVKVAVLRSTDFGGTGPAPGATVVATTEFDTFDSFVGVDVDSTGRAYVVWTERHPEAGETWSMLASSDDDGETWTRPVRVSTVGTTAFPWVTAGDDGRVAVSYYGTAAKGNSPETVAGDWRVYSAYSADAGRTWAETVATPEPVHQGSVCTSGTGCADGTRDLLDFFETGVDRNGCLLATYTDNSRDTVEGDERTGNEPELVAFVRQSGGPGLRAGKTCGPVTPAVAGPPVATPGAETPRPASPRPAAPRPAARPAPGALAATGIPALLPLGAAGLLLAAVALSRRGRARRAT